MSKILTRNRGTKDKPSWEYRFEVARIDGKRKHFSKSGFKTKSEALKAGTDALSEYNRTGKTFEPSQLSVSDFYDYWMKNYCEVNLSDNTTRSYETVIRLYVKPMIGQYYLNSIDTVTLQEFINQVYVEHGFKRSYLNTILKVLREGFRYACRTCKFIALDPASDVQLPNTDVKEDDDIIVLSKEDVSRILDRFKDYPYQYYPMLIAYYTGMRISEVYGLTWDCIDFEKQTITVNKIIKKFDYNSKKIKNFHGIKGKAQTKWYLGACKTSSSYRTIKIGNTLSMALRAYKSWQERCQSEYMEYYIKSYKKSEKTRNGRPVELIIQRDSTIPNDCPYEEVKLVCVKENGEFHGTDSMKYPSKVINSELNIRFNFHAFRHTHATMLIEQGVPVKAVAERLGHSNVRTTLDVYVKVTEIMENNAVDVFEANGSLQ